MIREHFVTIEKLIRDDPLVISSEIHKTSTSPETAYIKGEILFMDGTVLAFFEHVRVAGIVLNITDYRYHYMTEENEMIFRYDNAPHHQEVDTFPHHKHLPSGLQRGDMPGFESVMDEIDMIVVEKLI